jgi:D-alanine-D-alanine ligase
MSPSQSSARTQIAVLFGGPSAEHDVSCASAASIVQHLDRARFEVTPIRVTREGTWVVGKDDPSFSVVDVPAIVSMTAEDGSPDRAGRLMAGIEALGQVDVAFPAFHGRYGEDGMVQSLLELVGVPYVGNGVASSVVGMDKEWTKTLLRDAGLSVADGIVLNDGEDRVADADRDRLGLPVFVKPAREGSSIGVSRLDDWAQLDQALVAARRSDRKVLVEAAVRGRELDIAVLQHPDGRLSCGPPLEIRVEGGGMFDFEAKYHGPDGTLRFPDDLNPQVTALLQKQACQVFEILGCTGLLRVDFFLDEDGDSVRPIINEVNTFPGFSARSQFPRIFHAAGLEFTDLLTVLVDTALATTRTGSLKYSAGTTD